MARAFAITTAGDHVSLNPQGQGEITYTISNTTNRPLRAWPTIKALGSTDESWFSVVGGGERSFSPGESHQFVVKVQIPANAPAGKYSFRLNAISGSRDVEDESIEGPAASFEVKPALDTVPPPALPRWMIPVVGMVLIGGIVIAWLLWPSSEPEVMVQLPSVVGLSREAAQEAIEDKDLTLGQVTWKQQWAPQDHVLEQVPSANTAPVAEGTAIDLVLANSQHTFRSERILSKLEGTTTITAEYSVRLTRDIENGRKRGEFTLQAVTFRSSGEAEDMSSLEFITSQLVRTSGHLWMDTLDQPVDLKSSEVAEWRAFRQLIKQIEAESETDGAADPSNGEHRVARNILGRVLGLTMVSIEVGFDLMAIFQAIPADAGDRVERFHLQQGGFSTIRVEEPSNGPRIGNSIRTLSVVRKVNTDETAPFETIGTAEYNRDDGLLKRLDIRVNLEDQTYRTIIERE